MRPYLAAVVEETARATTTLLGSRRAEACRSGARPKGVEKGSSFGRLFDAFWGTVNGYKLSILDLLRAYYDNFGVLGDSFSADRSIWAYNVSYLLNPRGFDDILYPDVSGEQKGLIPRILSIWLEFDWSERYNYFFGSERLRRPKSVYISDFIDSAQI